MTFDPVNTKVLWTYWYSIKDNDGRRSSGVRKNRSRWHVLSEKEGWTICGKVVWISSDVYTEVPPLEQVCSRCFGMVK